MPTIETTLDQLEKLYPLMDQRLGIVQKRLRRSALTLAEKILLGHLADPDQQELSAGKSMLGLHPDRVVMQDATAQMALLQFMQAQIPHTMVPSTVHCDHLIRAHSGALDDMRIAQDENREVYDFLNSCSQKYGIGFWKPGAGIIHQVALENYAFPGTLMIGTDSHTPNAGGLAMLAVGVGGADAVDAMVGMPWEVLYPQLVGVRLTGSLSGWTAPKDVILKLCGILTVKGGTNRIIEYFGSGVKSISATGRATITNMGAELGATTSVFPCDERTEKYLQATGRGHLIEVLRRYAHLVTADVEVEKNPEKYFEQVVEINLSELEPHVVGPHTPDLARPVSQMAADAQKNHYPLRLSATLIGSCTNSSYEDICRAADVARQATAQGVKAAVPLLVTPGSEQVYQTIKRDGQMAALEAVGAKVLANACGPCIGMWQRDDVKKGEANSIMSSYNRNFPKRNDGNAATLSFIGSPEVVLAYSLCGDLSVDPLHQEFKTPEGKTVRLKTPAVADELPVRGFVKDERGYTAPPANASNVTVQVRPDSERLQLLDPFAPWDGKDFSKLPLLLKAKGKCTTDHISPAGPWLKFRGHLDKISDNMFTGAINAFNGEAGKTKNLLTGETQAIPDVARHYKLKGLRWVVVGDENYGEGSSREHAAMEPRYLGSAAIIVKSFARIHETNLKKQGMLPLTFSNAVDYDKVQEDDRVSILNLAQLAEGQPLQAVLHHADGSEDKMTLRHSLTTEQIAWFKAGSALNLIKEKMVKVG